ncbi:MAG: GreA/GreB family elongation factor [Planctomycetes bacterium]|nr:GreA/GreB family elongation factor [Planctomycetota bacterium]
MTQASLAAATAAPAAAPVQAHKGRDQILLAIQERRYNDIDILWLEMTEDASAPAAVLIDLADLLVRHKQSERALMLLLMLAARLKETGRFGDLLDTARAAANLAPQNEEIAGHLNDALRGLLKTRSDVERFVSQVRISGADDLRKTISRLDDLLAWQPGEYVYHAEGWGVGRVREIDYSQERLVVDFKQKAGHAITIAMAKKILRRLEPESYKALLHDRPAEFKRLAQADPLHGLVLVLKDHGRLCQARQVRERFAEAGFSAEEWAAWWKTARKLATNDPLIEITDEVQPRLALRDKPLSRDDEDRKLFARHVTFQARLEEGVAILARARETKRALADAAFLTDYFGGRLANGSPAERVASHLFLTTLAEEQQGAAPAPAAAAPGDLAALLRDADAAEVLGELQGFPAFQRRLLDYLKRHDPDLWAETAANAFLTAGREIWDHLLRDLVAASRQAEAGEALRMIEADPLEHAEQFLWLARQHLDGKLKGVYAPRSDVTLLERVIRVLDDLALRREKRGKEKQTEALITAYRGFLGHKECKYVRQVCAGRGADDFMVIENALLGCHGISDNLEEMLFHIVPRTRVGPEEGAGRPADEEAVDYTSTFYVTQESITRKQKELDEIISVHLPKAEEAIGTAMGHGDISENAEYEAAIEHRRDLDRRKNELASELSRAQPIDFEAVTTGRAAVGATVTVRDDQGRELAYRLLGPWDADAPRGVISYKSPLGHAFLGLAAGETAQVALADGIRRFTVLRVSNGRQ